MTGKKLKDREGIEARQRFRKQVRECAYEQAKVFAKGAAPSLDSMTDTERERFLTLYVHAELCKFFSETLEPRLSTPDGLRWMEHFRCRAGGLASSAASSSHSMRARLATYADRARQRDPTVTKGAILRAFCKSNPGENPGTVKRYLTDLI